MTPAPIESCRGAPRDTFCPSYNGCLDVAVERGWEGFACVHCPLAGSGNAVRRAEFVLRQGSPRVDAALWPAPLVQVGSLQAMRVQRKRGRKLGGAECVRGHVNEFTFSLRAGGEQHRQCRACDRERQAQRREGAAA